MQTFTGSKIENMSSSELEICTNQLKFIFSQNNSEYDNLVLNINLNDKKIKFCRALLDVLIRDFNNFRESVKIQILQFMKEIDISKSLFISSLPPSILNMSGKEILNSLKNSIYERNRDKLNNGSNKALFDLELINKLNEIDNIPLCLPSLTTPPNITMNQNLSNPLQRFYFNNLNNISNANLNNITTTGNSALRKTPKFKNTNTNYYSDNDNKSNSKNKTPGFKSLSQKELPMKNSKLKNNNLLFSNKVEDSKLESILKTPKINSLNIKENSKNFCEIYKSPSPVPSKKLKNKINNNIGNNIKMTPVKKLK